MGGWGSYDIACVVIVTGGVIVWVMVAYKELFRSKDRKVD